MRSETIMLALALATLSTAAGAQSGPVATSSANASVEIVGGDLNLTLQLDLAFGLLKGGNVAGSVVVKPEGIREPLGGAETVGSGPCHTVYCEDDSSNNNPQSAAYWGPGQFQVSGSPNSAYRVSTPPSAIAYLRTPASGRLPELTVHSFTVRTASQGSDVGTLDAQGNDSIRIGGTIDVPTGMKTGSYRVQVPITVQYY